MPSPSDFTPSSSTTSLPALTEVTSAPSSLPPANRPSGPREMPNAPALPPKLPLQTQFPGGMPKPPSPTYSPARNLTNPEGSNIRLPRATPRSLVGTGGRMSSAAAHAPGINIDSNSYFPPPAKNGLPDSRKAPVNLPHDTTVTPTKLYEYINRGSDQLSILLVDLRERSDFDQGHIFAKHVICIEPVVLRPGYDGFFNYCNHGLIYQI